MSTIELSLEESGWLEWAHTMLPERYPSGDPIDALLQVLSQRERQVLYLAAMCELAGPEIAEILGINVNSVYTYMHRVRRACQAWMSQ